VIIPLPIVAAAFFLTGAAYLVDAHMAHQVSRKVLRFFQAAVFFVAAVIYQRGASTPAAIPQPEIRILLVTICILGISEILSRWNIWGMFTQGRKNE